MPFPIVSGVAKGGTRPPFVGTHRPRRVNALATGRILHWPTAATQRQGEGLLELFHLATEVAAALCLPSSVDRLKR